MDSYNYEIGQYVVYGDDGVCRVVDIGKPDMPHLDAAEQFYFLKPLDYDGMIYAPVSSASHMRPVMEAGRAARLLDEIKIMNCDAVVCRDKKQMQAQYESMLAKDDCEAYARTVKSIYTKRGNCPSSKKKLSLMEEQLLKRIERSLVSELAVALNMPAETVRKRLESACAQ
ncbi:MAG: CarD family transcriptional regulator [Clostridia bacterium]|nr:CarD family transcriptional regulator [Clostridia bacterium]